MRKGVPQLRCILSHVYGPMTDLRRKIVEIGTFG